MSHTVNVCGVRWNRSLVAMGLLPIIVLCPACVPTMRALHHDPNAAAKKAEEFGRLAFVERNFSQAFAQGSPEMQNALSPETLEAEIAKLHPMGYPTALKASEFEPIPGQPGVNIFLTGEDASQKFHYRILMAGTVDSGYRVGGFWRGSGPYPASKMRRALGK